MQVRFSGAGNNRATGVPLADRASYNCLNEASFAELSDGRVAGALRRADGTGRGRLITILSPAASADSAAIRCHLNPRGG